MSNAVKNATFTTMVEGVLTDLMLKTTAAQVEVSEGVTLADKIQTILTAIDGKAATSHTHVIADVTGLDDKLATLATTEAMNTAISAAIDELIDGAPDTYDTLKEIATYITEHEDVVTALNAAIGNKADTSVVTALSDKVTALEGKAHEHANKNILDTVSTEPSLYGCHGNIVDTGLPLYVSAAVSTDNTFNVKIQEMVTTKLGMSMDIIGIGNTTVGDKSMFLPTMPLIKYTAPDEFFDESSLNELGVTKKQMQSAMTDAITPLTLFLNVTSKIADHLKNVRNDVKKIDSLGALASKDKVSTAELDETLTAEVAKIHEHSNMDALAVAGKYISGEDYLVHIVSPTLTTVIDSVNLPKAAVSHEGGTTEETIITPVTLLDAYADKMDDSFRTITAKTNTLSEKVTALETASASTQKTYISATQPEGLKNGDLWINIAE